MGYYKKIDVICVDGGRYSAESTKGDMKKRGVDKDNCVVLTNRVEKIELVTFHEVSGSVEYGMEVVLDCTLQGGTVVRTTVSGMKYLHWIQKGTVVNGIMEGDFLFLFKGVVEELVKRGDAGHENFVTEYMNQEGKKQRASKLDVQVGDIVNIYGGSIYLGEFYYYKPNLKNKDGINKLRKYKLYIERDEDGSYIDNRLHVESGKTDYNQPTEVLGSVDIDMELLKRNARERMGNIYTEGVGYKKGTGYYSRIQRDACKNNKAYVLSNIAVDKKDIVYPYIGDLLKLGWLCDWDADKNMVEYKTSSRGNVIPYQYVLKQ